MMIGMLNLDSLALGFQILKEVFVPELEGTVYTLHTSIHDGAARV